jgi:hypothetical protein
LFCQLSTIEVPVKPSKRHLATPRPKTFISSGT